MVGSGLILRRYLEAGQPLPMVVKKQMSPLFAFMTAPENAAHWNEVFSKLQRDNKTSVGGRPIIAWSDDKAAEYQTIHRLSGF